jgi:hypothetical protein
MAPPKMASAIGVRSAGDPAVRAAPEGAVAVGVSPPVPGAASEADPGGRAVLDVGASLVPGAGSALGPAEPAGAPGVVGWGDVPAAAVAVGLGRGGVAVGVGRGVEVGDGVGVGGGVGAVKVAAIETEVFGLKMQVEPWPAHGPLAHPANRSLPVGVAVRASWSPDPNSSEQVEPHEIPRGVLTTVPDPEPVFVTETVTGESKVKRNESVVSVEKFAVKWELVPSHCVMQRWLPGDACMFR